MSRNSGCRPISNFSVWYNPKFACTESGVKVEDLSELEQEGIVQRFEYTFELSWKVMQDLLTYKGYEFMTGPNGTLKMAFEDGLISDHDGWRQMAKSRNTLSHVYDEGEAEEYGIGTFVYQRRRPFDLGKFDYFVARQWPKGVIRCKGMCYFGSEYDTCYVFEQAGRQVSLRNAGQWYATMPEAQREILFAHQPDLAADWDAQYGDRMQKLVFIGQKMDAHMKEFLKEMLDNCLADE